MLSAEELKELKLKRYDVPFNEGEMIFKQGTAAHDLLSVASGRIKLFFEGIDHQNITFKIANRWDILGGPGLFLDNRHYYSAMAIEESTVCYTNLDHVKRVLFGNKDFVSAFLRETSLETVHLYNRFLSNTQKQMNGKMADALLYLSEVVFKENNSEVVIKNKDLAELSGMTKDNVVRILKQFKNDNLIQIKGDSLIISNLEKLHECSRRG